MKLTPKEQEKLMLHMAGELAAQRKGRGLKLNYTEAVAYISSRLLEMAREGKSVVKLMELGRQLLTEEDVMEGVSMILGSVQVEASFPDGTKLVTVHDPIQPKAGHDRSRCHHMRPGEILPQDRDIILNKGRKSKQLLVANTGDRPIQVGSHFHFFEVNRLLVFDRPEAFGYRLDIPSGTSVRFEPGVEKEIDLVELGGRKTVYGCNDLTQGRTDPKGLEQAMERAASKSMLQDEEVRR